MLISGIPCRIYWYYSVHNVFGWHYARCIIVSTIHYARVLPSCHCKSTRTQEDLMPLAMTAIKKLEKLTSVNKKMDLKDFGIGAQILEKLDITKIKLLTNTRKVKRVGLSGYGLEIVERIKY